MNPWSINPVWQNFSSLYREAAVAGDSPNEISRFHHLTVALYFGVSTIESFLNSQLRQKLSGQGVTEDNIFDRLRKTYFRDKLKKWPTEITGGSLVPADKMIEKVALFADIRDNLTHPKTSGHDIYEDLEKINPKDVVQIVAEYCIAVLGYKGEEFPYWFLGWNYFNPRANSQELYLLNNQQFSHSLVALGFRVPAFDALKAEVWRKNHMGTVNGYAELKSSLEQIKTCEPHDERFPLKPILCNRWWTVEHQGACGNVSP